MPKQKLNQNLDEHYGYCHQKKIHYTPEIYLVIQTLLMDELWIKKPKPGIKNAILDLWEMKLIPEPIWTSEFGTGIPVVIVEPINGSQRMYNKIHNFLDLYRSQFNLDIEYLKS